MHSDYTLTSHRQQVEEKGIVRHIGLFRKCPQIKVETHLHL